MAILPKEIPNELRNPLTRDTSDADARMAAQMAVERGRSAPRDFDWGDRGHGILERIKKPVAMAVGAGILAAAGVAYHNSQPSSSPAHPAGAEITDIVPNGTQETSYKSWDQLTRAQQQEAVDLQHGGVSSSEQP